MKNLLIVLALFLSLALSAQDRYISASANGSGNGLSVSTPWSWSQFRSNAVCGMTAHVRAGNYGSTNQTFGLSCTAGNELIIRGYQSTPNDINAASQTFLPTSIRNRRGTTRLAGNVEFDYTTTPNSSQMPYFSKPYLRDDIVFNITGDYITLENLIINGGAFAVLSGSSSSNLSIINCIFREQGDMTLSSAHTSNPDRYQGTGISVRGSSNPTVLYCSFLNVEQNAFQLNGVTSGTFQNNVVYSYNTINGTDYGFLLSNNSGTPSSNLLINYNLVHRVPNVPHGMHGFIVKNGAVNNEIKNFRVINSNIEASFANSNNNLFENGDISGSFQINGDALAYILTANGTRNNTFRNITIDGVYGGLAFKDDGEDGTSLFSGYDNNYINITVKNAVNGVWVTGTGGPFNTNNFVNCNFYNLQYGIRMQNTNSGNRFINCHFSTTSALVTNGGGSTLNTNTIFTNNHFSGNLNANSASAYNDTGNISGNPMFTSAPVNGNFDISGLMPLSGSPLIDAGIDASITIPLANVDALGNARGINSSDDIGVFEFGGTSTPPTPTTPNGKPIGARNFINFIN